VFDLGQACNASAPSRSFRRPPTHKKKEEGMTLTRIVRLAAFGALLAVTTPALAQTTSMPNFAGSRHAGPQKVDASSSSFDVGMTRDNGATFDTTAGVSDTVDIRGVIHPEPGNVGWAADIFVVDWLRDTNEFRMRTKDNVWVPWNATVSTLIPYQEHVTLTSALSVPIFTGTLGTAGNHRIFLGYRAPDGILRYHTTGMPVTVTETPTQTPLEQATVFFAASISAQIVLSNNNGCIQCHTNGGAAQGLSIHSFVSANTSNHLTTNFTQFRNLFTARGKAFILSKVRGESNHVGGQVLPPTSQDYRNLEQFLDLLGNI
jgi:hypothetical protein